MFVSVPRSEQAHKMAYNEAPRQDTERHIDMRSKHIVQHDHPLERNVGDVEGSGRRR